MSVRRGEDAVLSRVRRRLAAAGNHLPGDDAALLAIGGGLAVTVDQQIAGVHFAAGLDEAAWGRRLVGAAFSDVAAVGGVPTHALLAVTGAAGLDVERLLLAVAGACREHGAELAGGDLAGGPTAGASLTVLARRAPRGRWVERRAARPGDRLWLGGSVGQAALGRLVLRRCGAGRDGVPRRLDRLPAGLRPAASAAARRHLAPRPQLALGWWLARRRRAAAIDVSDGVALDLRRLCAASGVGAELAAEALPLAAAAPRLARALAVDAIDLALHGGEDYVLLFALPAGISPPPALGCVAIGRITRRRQLRLLRAGGRGALPAGGWDHLAAR